MRGVMMKERKQGSIREYSLRILAFAAFLLFLSSVFSAGSWAKEKKDEEGLPEDFTELSIEDLMSIEVTTFSRKAQKLSQTAAAVFVITQADIRRSGATNIPEALRMVPGLQVARIDANKWAISSRGFNGRFANKLLVLMDGRSVYTPVFSGVFWDVQDTSMEDIDRIEVIRGPGASAWGPMPSTASSISLQSRHRIPRAVLSMPEPVQKKKASAVSGMAESFLKRRISAHMQNILTVMRRFMQMDRMQLMSGMQKGADFELTGRFQKVMSFPCKGTSMVVRPARQ